MPRTLSTTDPSDRFRSILDKSLKAYTKKTGKDLLTLPLFRDLSVCNSPEEILDKPRDPNLGFNQPGNSDDSWSKWLIQTVKVLYELSATLGKVAGSVRLKRLNGTRWGTVV